MQFWPEREKACAPRDCCPSCVAGHKAWKGRSERRHVSPASITTDLAKVRAGKMLLTGVGNDQEARVSTGLRRATRVSEMAMYRYMTVRNRSENIPIGKREEAVDIHRQADRHHAGES